MEISEDAPSRNRVASEEDLEPTNLLPLNLDEYWALSAETKARMSHSESLVEYISAMLEGKVVTQKTIAVAAALIQLATEEEAGGSFQIYLTKSAAYSLYALLEVI